MLTSIIRTVTPIIVGWVLSLGVVQALGLTEEQVTWLVVAALTALPPALSTVYYLAVRALERRWPWVGVLLGRRGEPDYGRHEAGAP